MPSWRDLKIRDNQSRVRKQWAHFLALSAIVAMVLLTASVVADSSFSIGNAKTGYFSWEADDFAKKVSFGCMLARIDFEHSPEPFCGVLEGFTPRNRGGTLRKGKSAVLWSVGSQ